MALVLLAMSFGARVLPKLQKPARLLLITEADADEIRQKLAKERTFGQLNDVCSWQAAELPAFLAQNDAVLIASDVPKRLFCLCRSKSRCNQLWLHQEPFPR